jgi:hypothetical protein
VTLVLAGLAVFWVWEYLLVLLPWEIHPAGQPLVVLGLGVLASITPDKVLLPAAIAGVVGLLHVLVRAGSGVLTKAVQFPTRQPRRSDVGSRVPGL